MITTCHEFEQLVSLRAANALSTLDELRLKEHLSTCERCPAELSALEETVELLRLPPQIASERLALASLGADTLEELRRRGTRVRHTWSLAAGVAMAAALVLMVTVPALLHHEPMTVLSESLGTPKSDDVAVWQEPDLEAIWAATSAIELEPASKANGRSKESGTASLLAAYDAGMGY